MVTRQIIFIESNIGVGKSTAIEYLKNHPSDPHIVLLEEPVSHWQNIPKLPLTTTPTTLTTPTLNLLDHFYQDIPKYGYCFQTYAFLSRMKLLLDSIQSSEIQTVIAERSIFTDREIFLKTLAESGQVTEMEQAVYHQLWDFWIQLMRPYFKDVQIKFLYLRCSPEQALERQIKRNRTEESGVGLEYLTTLDQRHDQLYLENQSHLQKLVKALTDSDKFQVDVLNNTGDLSSYHKKLAEYFSN